MGREVAMVEARATPSRPPSVPMPPHGPTCCPVLAPDPDSAPFPDPRLRRRLGLLLCGLEDHPNLPFPLAFAAWADRKAAYRFLDHPHTTVAALLPALVQPTLALAGHLDRVLLIHDSTSFNFSHLK